MSNPPPDPSLGYVSQIIYTSPPIGWRAPAAKIAIICVMLSEIVISVLLFFVESLQGIGDTPTGSELTRVFVIVGGMLVGWCGQVIAVVCAAVFMCMWTHRANRVAQVLFPNQLKFSPGWAAGWWFVPFANLVIPPRVMAELVTCANKSEEGRPVVGPAITKGIVTAWWVCFLMRRFLSLIASLLPNDGEHPQFIAMAVLGAISTVFSIAACVLVLRLIKGITARLTAAQGGVTETVVVVENTPFA